MFIEDHQLVTPAILETVSSLLSGGEVGTNEQCSPRHRMPFNLINEGSQCI
jgi:hypothetical protein